MSSAARNELLLKKIRFLKTVPLFATLPEDALTQIARDFYLKVYDKNEVILRQGDPSHELYILLKGKVRVYKTSPGGDETIINILAPPEIIGEFAIVDGEPRSATARAIDQCLLLGIARDDFLHHLQNFPKLSVELCRLVIGKARWASRYAETLARYDTADRLLYLLLHFNELLGREIEPGRRYEMHLGLNQADLAALVGARRGWINHILRDWRDRGLVEYKAGAITILDLPRVQEELENRLHSDVEW